VVSDRVADRSADRSTVGRTHRVANLRADAPGLLQAPQGLRATQAVGPLDGVGRLVLRQRDDRRRGARRWRRVPQRLSAVLAVHRQNFHQPSVPMVRAPAHRGSVQVTNGCTHRCADALAYCNPDARAHCQADAVTLCGAHAFTHGFTYTNPNSVTDSCAVNDLLQRRQPRAVDLRDKHRDWTDSVLELTVRRQRCDQSRVSRHVPTALRSCIPSRRRKESRVLCQLFRRVLASPNGRPNRGSVCQAHGSTDC
jgi:hypothetical protein